METLRVGVCEDHEPIRRALVRALRQAGHDVVPAHNGREAVALFGSDASLDVIVMDIGLPDADGRDVVRALKSAGQLAPVLFLTALDAVHDKLEGFAAGADDYVVKPFELREVLVRLEVLAARRPAEAVSDRGFVLDPLTHSVRTSRGEVRLSPTEFRMLAAIAARPGQVVRRRTVVAAAWPDGASVSENTIDSYIRRIRTKLDEIESPSGIETVRGVGFRVL
ncbi:response regulator transcription factor [Nocardioides sp. R-C-SC26]|uniref:response regulator transcription factor n=1 Tax=Nocardioides sp. R-C-SC26 TaxID=2870414 RepID=UPI001E30B1F7|nr:response regulator transcription factor [Nocardioides sp. R-C-SC26]